MNDFQIVPILPKLILDIMIITMYKVSTAIKKGSIPVSINYLPTTIKILQNNQKSNKINFSLYFNLT